MKTLADKPTLVFASVLLACMSTLHQFSRITFLCITCNFGSLLSATTTPVPDERDRQVLEAVLLHLLADSKFDMTRAPINGAEIVLYSRTPEKTGFLMSHIIRGDIGSRTLPGDAEEDVRRRNTPIDAKPGIYDAITAFYTNLTFAASVVLADLPDKTVGRQSDGASEKAHPKARGFVRAYLPGYSKDGTRAVVRAVVGP